MIDAGKNSQTGPLATRSRFCERGSHEEDRSGLESAEASSTGGWLRSWGGGYDGPGAGRLRAVISTGRYIGRSLPRSGWTAQFAAPGTGVLVGVVPIGTGPPIMRGALPGKPVGGPAAYIGIGIGPGPP
jgi:hypothetical protein